MKKLTIKSITGAIALFSLIPSALAAGFTDIPSTSPYFLSTTYLQEKGIISGYQDGTFKPFNQINRAELLKILVEGANIETTTPKTNCFPDVPFSQWYAPYICTAKDLGVINGYPDNTFRPEQPINKVEAMKMLGEIYQWDTLKAADVEIFSDTPIEEWYAPYIQYAKLKNLLPTSGDTYLPGNFITRGSISETLYRLIAITELKADKYSSSIADSISKELNIETPIKEFSESFELISIDGLITDAITGSKIQATVTIADNTGSVISSTQSDDTGAFSLADIPVETGAQITFSKDNYFNLTIPVDNVKNKSIHTSLSRTFTKIAPEELRIVLTWGESDSDFDAHLIDPDGEEIFFMHRISSDLSSILDIDSTKEFGTETITINDLKKGQYKFFVHHYTGADSFKTSSSRVEIYNKAGLAKIYFPGSTSEEKNIWQVFYLDENGIITDVNELTDCTSLSLKELSSICL